MWWGMGGRRYSEFAVLPASSKLPMEPSDEHPRFLPCRDCQTPMPASRGPRARCDACRRRRNARRRKVHRCLGCNRKLPDREGKGGRPKRCDTCRAKHMAEWRKAWRGTPKTRTATCARCDAEFSYEVRRGTTTRKLCDKCRERRRNAVCRKCGKSFRYVLGRGGRRTRCDECRGHRRRCKGCECELAGRALKWCDACRPTEAERSKRYYERNRAKVLRRMDRARRICSGCGAQLLRPATLCGFCEAEDPLLRAPPS